MRNNPPPAKGRRNETTTIFRSLLLQVLKHPNTYKIPLTEITDFFEEKIHFQNSPDRTFPPRHCFAILGSALLQKKLERFC